MATMMTSAQAEQHAADALIAAVAAPTRVDPGPPLVAAIEAAGGAEHGGLHRDVVVAVAARIVDLAVRQAPAIEQELREMLDGFVARFSREALTWPTSSSTPARRSCSPARATPLRPRRGRRSR
jgi:hypothetical protein